MSHEIFGPMPEPILQERRARLRKRAAMLARRRRAAALVGAVALLALVAGLLTSLGGNKPLPPLPAPGLATGPGTSTTVAYAPAHATAFVARASTGEAHVLYTKSPGGVLATAARVASFRRLIDKVCAGSSVAPTTLEGIVFLESAGYPEAIAGGDPANAAGLTQIVASTGQSLLGMQINLARSRFLTGRINQAADGSAPQLVGRLERQRAQIDPRFDPGKALAATVRYLEHAQQIFARPDLAIESYHMGIGNLQNVLSAYDGGAPVPYVQLYFGTAPDEHAAAYQLLSSFGDDSWTYYWRVLAAEQIMRLYRRDRGRLERLSALQTRSGSAALVLHPPNQTASFPDPSALDEAYAHRVIKPLPANANSLGLAYDPAMGTVARRFGFQPALYRGLRPAALDALIWMAARVRTLSGQAPLIVTSTVTDQRAQRLLGYSDPPAAAGWSFTIARRYVSGKQAAAFQAVLDRLQAINLIAWERFPDEIEVTVAADAPRVLAHGV